MEINWLCVVLVFFLSILVIYLKFKTAELNQELDRQKITAKQEIEKLQKDLVQAKKVPTYECYQLIQDLMKGQAVVTIKPIPGGMDHLYFRSPRGDG